MKKIGGNILATVQVKDTEAVNQIGEHVPEWKDVATLKGWLDLATGDSRIQDYETKVQDSTHYFLCDYQELDDVRPENCRLVINDQVYEVLLIDTPMELNYHMEWYLRFIGGKNDVS